MNADIVVYSYAYTARPVSGSRLGIQNARTNNTLRKALLRVRVDRIDPEGRFSIAIDGSLVNPARIYAPAAAEMDKARKSMPEWTYEARTLKGPWIWMESDLTSNRPAPGEHVISVWPDGRTAHESLLTDVDVHVQYDFAGHQS